jgi:hypothetical protein
MPRMVGSFRFMKCVKKNALCVFDLGIPKEKKTHSAPDFAAFKFGGQKQQVKPKLCFYAM